MIQLRFVKAHRSINELPSIDLPDFTIITGVNGSGKTQLLEAIANESIKVEGTPIAGGQIRIFNWNSLVPSSENPVDPTGLIRSRSVMIKTAAEKLTEIKKDIKANIAKQIEPLKIQGFPIDNDEVLFALTESSFVKYVGEKHKEHWPLIAKHIPKSIEPILKIRPGHHPQHQYLFKFLIDACNLRRISMLSLSADDINALVPIDWAPKDVFQHNISEIFATYYGAWEENLKNDFYNHRYGHHNKIYTKEEFEHHFGGPPWDFVNRLINEAGLDFEVVFPVGRVDMAYQAKLKNKTSGAEIVFNDLSSGEKIIMSFALCVYNVQRKIMNVENYPKILLFDEIDAPLHPSMTRGLIGAIQNVLVKEKGIKVILTTHSPATVAFAPKDSLYCLKKNPRQLALSARDEAIQTLTSGYISVTDNSRFILVEAQIDQIFYTKIYKKLVERAKVSISPNLVFISAGIKKDADAGGKEKVTQWGQKLLQAGLTQIYGLIDRDSANVATENIKTLKRYSIENYILDPIMVYAVLVDTKNHLAVLDIGITDFDYRQLKTASNEILQSVVNEICRRVEAVNPCLATNSRGRFDVEYICGKQISLPSWMRDHRGHDLVDLYRQTFKDLIGHNFMLTKNDCSDLISMLTDRLPDFIPLELAQCLAELCPDHTSKS